MTIAGGITGTLFSLAGAGLHSLWGDGRIPLAITLGTVALVYTLHELDFIQLPVPGRDWQVPAHWVRDGFYRSAAIFGSIVGFGVFTRVPYASLPVFLAWLFVFGNPLYGALAGLLYGAARALSIYSSAATRDTEELVTLNQRLMALIPSIHLATGAFLAAFGAYLVIAPALQ